MMWMEHIFTFGLILVCAKTGQCASQFTDVNNLLKGTVSQLSVNSASSDTTKVQPEIDHVNSIWNGASIDISSISGKRPSVIPVLPSAPSKQIMTQALNTATAKVLADDTVDKSMAGVDTPNSQTEAFGPHLLTSNEAIKIGESAQIMIETAKDAMTKQNIEPSKRRDVLEKLPDSVVNDIRRKAKCKFTAGPCDVSSKYRTADGSCNNLDNPVWGKSLTPFERFIPSFYEDGLDEPRKKDVFDDPLPGARTISVNVHTVSSSADLMNDLSHFSMEFGQFVSHDIQMNALSKGLYHSNLNCCLNPNRRNCFPITIPPNDPFYGSFNRTCMNFVRALQTTDLDCNLGPRQQLNQNTHFLDGSAIYGSTKTTADSLREFSGGRLLSSTNGELLPKDTVNAASCILPSSSSVKCFKAGDPRVNQQPALMSLQTIWMKEHNRIANRLSQLNVGWNDEKIYQETRKIVGALIQHVTYNEYLPHILGSQQMTKFQLQPLTSGYFTGYDTKIKPQIRNSFAAAAFRFGHSMVRQKMSYNGPLHTNQDFLLHNVFLKPDLLYQSNGGVSSITKGLYEDFSQKVDRKLTKELTEHLFERIAGQGSDLAAINIQRGRDHGLVSYNIWRIVCNLTPADDFTEGVAGGLQHHTAQAAQALQNTYASTWDIDLFAGGVSEIPVNGGKVGPTFACLIGLQFKALKFGDRFFYESNTNVKFTSEQLTEIKKATMARIICDNTNINSLPADVFKKKSSSNSEVSCASLPEVNLQKWQNCIDGGWSPYVQRNGCYRVRKCNNPKPNACGKPCVGSPIMFKCTIDLPRLPSLPGVANFQAVP